MDIGDSLKDYEEENIEGSNKNIQQNVPVLYASFQWDVANLVHSGIDVKNYVWKIAWVEAN